MWARFYEIGTNRPIFSDRDGIPKRELSEIGYERRNGYAWLGYWPQRLLEREYPAWRDEVDPRTGRPVSSSSIRNARDFSGFSAV